MEGFDDKPVNGGISFNDAPPKAGPELWIHRLSGGEELTCTVIGTKVRGVDTHWVGGRTQPHYRDEANCPGCQNQIRIDWKGYLHVFHWDKRAQIFLELTPNSFNALMAQITEDRPLRGAVLKIKRTKAKNGRLIVVVDQYSPKRENLPQERDPMSSILKLWKIYDDPGEVPTLPKPTGPEPDYGLEPPPDDLM